MNIDMSEVNSMLLDYADEARQSKGAANEVVEETLRELGYSKRDKDNVRKLFQKPLDWLIRSKGTIIGVVVNKLDTNLADIATDELFGQAMNRKVNILIITDGKIYNVFRYSNKDAKKAYIKVDSIDISSLSDKNMRVINAISAEGIDVKVLDNIMFEGSLGKDETVALLKEYVDSNKDAIVAFVREHKPYCSVDDIDRNMSELASLIEKSVLTPDELRNSYEAAEKKYINAISSKNNEIHDLERKVEEYIEKNAELQHEIDVLSKKDYKHAVETLEFIAKNSGDNSKRYAGYINDEIYTSSKLHKFVGEMLQRLYAIKAVEAHAYIFDGEYFRLNSMNAKNNDMVIKNTVYDIMVSEDEADDALIRLRAIYSHFPDIVFACMEIGFSNVKHNTGIDDELLKEDDEYDTLDSDLEIIDSEIKHENAEPAQEDTEPAQEDTEPVQEDAEPVQESLEDSIPNETEQGATDNDQDTQGQQEQNELDVTNAEHTESVEPLSTREIIVKHICGLDFSDSILVELLSGLDIQFYNIINTVENTDEATIIDNDIEDKVDDLDSLEESTAETPEDSQDVETLETPEGNQGLDNPVSNITVDITKKETSIPEDNTNIASELEQLSNSDESLTEESSEQGFDDIVELNDSEDTETEEPSNTFNSDADDYDSQSEDSNTTEQLENNDQVDQAQAEEYESEHTEDLEQSQQDEQESNSILIVTALSAANSLVSDYVDDLEFNNIEAVTAEGVAFDVNSNYEDLTYDELLVKSLNAVLAIDIYSDLNSKVVTKLKHKRLEELSDFIQFRSADLAEFPSIAGTKYVVCGIENINDLVYTLTRICQAIEVDIDKIYMFMTITTESEVIMDNYGTTFESIQFRNTMEEYTQGEIENTTISLVRGELFNNLLVTGNSIKVYADIFKKVLGVKTAYMELNIDGNEYTSLEAISYMLREAEKREIDLSEVKFGPAFGESHKLISFDPDEVGDNPYEIELYSGDIIYCASLEEWQAVVSLIRVHNILFKNSPIVVKVQVDMDAINFYGSEYDTEIATDSLAICGLAHYVSTHIPQRHS